MNPASLAPYYCVEKPDVKDRSSVMGRQNVIGRYNNKFAKGAG